MSKKVIGIYADSFNGKVGQTFAYMQFFSQFGYVRMISTLDNLENLENEIDVLVLPGGADVDVSTYGAIPGVMDSRGNQHYEYLDKVLLPKFIAQNKPIIGICRGMQRLNTWFGGTLNQHVVGHQQASEDRSSTRQRVQFTDNEEEILVNTMHHQSVDVLGRGFDIIGYSQMYQGCYGSKRHVFPWREFEKGKQVSRNEIYTIVEVIKHSEFPIIGFQFHPEEYNCRYAVKMIEELIEN